MLGVITYNRLHLLARSLASLQRTAFDYAKLITLDDHSDVNTVAWLRRAVPVLFNTPHHMGADQATYYLCDVLAAQCPNFFVISGSDIIYSKNWYSKLQDLWTHAKRVTEKVAMVGAFRGTNHAKVTTRFGNNLCRVTSLTGPVLVSTEFWRRERDRIDPNQCDLSMSRVAGIAGWQLFCAERSFVQHVGILDGLHLNAPDIGLGFIGENEEFLRVPVKSETRREVARFLHEGHTRLLLYDDGTATFGAGEAWWESDENILTIHDEVWSHKLKLAREGYTGFAYPCGTDIVGHAVQGKKA